MSHTEVQEYQSMASTKIGIASDHGGFALKEAVKRHFKDLDFDDVGTHTTESCDYPDYVSRLCRKIQSGELDRGIVICGTGIGASITANKMNGIRAALCCNEFMADMAKRHNNANVLALGARVLGDEFAMRIVARWLDASFEGGRHQNRIDKISELEKAP
jgi:ribose 5-phosphate isomerase B